jgi:hypothetical protein
MKLCCTILYKQAIQKVDFSFLILFLFKNPGLLRFWHRQSNALTTRLNLIHLKAAIYSIYCDPKSTVQEYTHSLNLQDLPTLPWLEFFVQNRTFADRSWVPKTAHKCWRINLKTFLKAFIVHSNNFCAVVMLPAVNIRSAWFDTVPVCSAV